MRDRLRLVTVVAAGSIGAAAVSSGCAKRSTFTAAPPPVTTTALPEEASGVPPQSLGLTTGTAALPQPSPSSPAALALTDDQAALGGYWFGGLPATFVALGLDASILTAPVQNDGRFQLALDKGTSYVIVVVPGAVAGNGASLALLNGAPGVARVKIASLGLDDIPTQRVTGPIELGTLAGTGGVVTPVRDFDETQGLASLGLTEAEARLVGRWDDAATLYSTLDADGDGRVDALQGRQPRLAVHYAWGRDGDAGTLGAAAQDPVDLEATISDGNHQSTTLVWSLPWSETLPTHARLTFPTMDACDTPATCTKGATELTTEITVDPDTHEATTRMLLDQRADGAKAVPLQGDYGVDLGDDGHYLFHNVRPRALTDDRSVVAPAVRLRTTDGKLIGIDYAWQVKDLGTGHFRDMTTTELALLFTGSPEASAEISCQSGAGALALSCRLPLTQVAGQVSGIACPKGWDGTALDDLASCTVRAVDIFGTVVSYRLFR